MRTLPQLQASLSRLPSLQPCAFPRLARATLGGNRGWRELQQSLQLRGVRSRRPARVQAGLNYPHMPNRLRRQKQELKYIFVEQLGRLQSFLLSQPLLQAVMIRLQPLLLAMQTLFEAISRWWLVQQDRYYEFCLEETKRKYKWEAYTLQERAFWGRSIKSAVDRASGKDWQSTILPLLGVLAFFAWWLKPCGHSAVLMTLFVWEFAAPCALLWTFVVPYLACIAFIDAENPVGPMYWLLLVFMLLMKHPLGAPLRLV